MGGDQVTVCAVVGLGYVGLPLVVEASASGVRVVGLDSSVAVVDALNKARSHVDDVSDADVASALASGFTATTETARVREADVVVICVPTPLAADGGPDLTAVKEASSSIAPHLSPGTLVVLESTTYPGTTAEVVVPLLIEGSGLSVPEELRVAYSPERIDPGNPTYGLRNTPKVVGADDDASRDAAAAFYGRVTDTVVMGRGTREAEAAKLLENTYRHVNIALVNEMAKFFHELEIDIWDVIRLASSKPFGFQPFRPGPGVGGHCIPIDPNYLSHRVRAKLGYSFRFVELAQEINESMPAYVCARVADLLNDAVEEGRGKAIRGSTILLVGVTYKPDIADQRESPAVAVARRLLNLGAHVEWHDPFVEAWEVEGVTAAVSDVLAAAAAADATVLLVNHSIYEPDAIAAAARVLLDTRGVTTDGTGYRL